MSVCGYDDATDDADGTQTDAINAGDIRDACLNVCACDAALLMLFITTIIRSINERQKYCRVKLYGRHQHHHPYVDFYRACAAQCCLWMYRGRAFCIYMNTFLKSFRTYWIEAFQRYFWSIYLKHYQIIYYIRCVVISSMRVVDKLFIYIYKYDNLSEMFRWHK